MSNKLKKAFSLLLAAIMCLSLLPAMAFAEEEQPLTYVALGDSMSQGYMFTDYNENPEGHYCGWEGSSEKGYIKKFAEVLEADTGAPIDLLDLTIQGLQPDEVYAFLKPDNFDFDSMTKGARKHIGWWTGDYVTDEEQNPDTYLFETFDAMSDYYIDSIKKADVITYDLGMNYFGTYLTDARDKDEVFTTLLTNSFYTQQVEFFRKQLTNYLKLNKMEAISDRLNGILYAYVSYLYYTDKCIDAIYDLNPDVQLILIPLSNPHRDLYVDINGFKVSYSDVIDLMMDSLNTYMRTTDKNRDRYIIAKLDGPVTSFADELYYYPDTLSEDAKALLERAVLGNESLLGQANYPAPDEAITLYDTICTNVYSEYSYYLSQGWMTQEDFDKAYYGTIFSYTYFFMFEHDDAGAPLKDENGKYYIKWNNIDRIIYEEIAAKYDEETAFKDFFGNIYEYLGDYTMQTPINPCVYQVNCDTHGEKPGPKILSSLLADARAAVENETAADWQKHIVEAVGDKLNGWEALCLKAATYRVMPSGYLSGEMPNITVERVIELLNNPDSATKDELIALHAGIRNGQAARGFGAHPCPRGLDVKYRAVMKVYENGLRTELPGIKNDLTIHYVYADGSQPATDQTYKVVIGEQYSVETPVVEGYVADKTKVSGTMGKKDVNVTVTYAAPITEGCTDETELDPPTNGTHHLYLNGRDMGEFTFAKSGNKWSIQNGDSKYLTVQNGRLAYNNSADACWTYQNNAFTVSVQTATRSSYNPFGWPFGGFGYSAPKTTTYYLTASGNALSVSTSAATAAVYDVTSVGNHVKGECVHENEKAATCKEPGSYDEVYYCVNCGEELSRSHVVTEVTEEHTRGRAKTENINGVNYTVTRCTVCGKILEQTEIPDGEITADVTVSSSVTYFLFIPTRVYNVQINASSSVPGVRISKVQYSTNGYTWSTGSRFSAAARPGTVYVRVTDSVGTVTNFTYSNGTTVKD